MKIRHQGETTLPPVADVEGPNRLIVKQSPGRGRGVFAGQDFEEGEVVEVCPVIVLPADQNLHMRLTTLGRYTFSWPRGVGVVLGYGALVNHSATPNTAWNWDVDENVVLFSALRPVTKGEEITHDYGRRIYRPGTVDAPPWWSGLRPTPSVVKAVKASVAIVGAVVCLGIARRWSRRGRRSSEVNR